MHRKQHVPGLILAGLAAILLVATPALADRDARAAKKLLAANARLQDKDWALAAKHYREFLSGYRNHDDRPAAEYGLGICLYQLKQYDQAEKHLLSAIQADGFKQAPEARALLGQTRQSAGDLNGALKAFQSLLDKHADHTYADLAHLNVVRILHQQGQTDKALQQAGRFLDKRKDSGYRTAVLYVQGLALQKQKKPVEAAESFRRIYENAPNSPYTLNALLLAGQCYEDAGKLDPALSAYRKLIDQAPPERKDTGRYSLAVALQRAERYKDAVEAFQQLIEKSPDSRLVPPGRLQMGICQLKTGKAQDAAKAFTEVIKNDKNRAARATYWLARTEMAREKYEQAAGRLAELLEKADKLPELAAARYDLATCYLQIARYEQAAGQFQHVIENHGKTSYAPDAEYRRAWCLRQAGKPEEALQVAEGIANQNGHPMRAAAMELAAETRFAQGQYDQAESHYARLAEEAKDKTAPRIRLRSGQCAFYQEEYQQAIRRLEDLAKQRDAAKSRSGRQAMLFLGQALLKTDKPDRAVEWLEAFVKADPQSHRLEGQYYLARALRENAKPGKAVDVLRTFRDARSSDAPIVVYAWYEQAELLQDQDKLDEAEKVLARILQADAPEAVTASARLLHAWIAYEQGSHKTAAERFEAFAQEHPKHPHVDQARFRQAEALRQAGSPDRALPLFRKLAESNPAAARLVGTCLAAMDKHEEAAKALGEVAKDKNRVNQQVLYELAWAHRDAKQLDQAVEAYRRLLKDYPEGKLAAASRVELAERLYARDKLTEASKLLEAALADKDASKDLQSQARYRLGWCYQKLDEPAKAREAFARFAKDNPQDDTAPTALYWAGVLALDTGDAQTAEGFLGKLLADDRAGKLKPLALLKLGQARTRQNDYREAMKAYQSFLKDHKDHRFAYLAEYGMGWCLQNESKFSEARKWYTRIADSDHKGETAAKAQFQIGECYFEEGKLQDALAAFYAVGDIYDYDKWTATALYEAGRVLEKLKKPSEAATKYRVIVQKYKDQTIAAAARKRLDQIEKSSPR